MVEADVQECSQCTLPAKYRVGSVVYCAAHAADIAAFSGLLVVKVTDPAPEEPVEEPAQETPPPRNTLIRGYYCGYCEVVHEGEPEQVTVYSATDQDSSSFTCVGDTYPTDVVREEPESEQRRVYWCSENNVYSSGWDGALDAPVHVDYIWECGECEDRFVTDPEGSSGRQQAAECCGHDLKDD